MRYRCKGFLPGTLTVGHNCKGLLADEVENLAFWWLGLCTCVRGFLPCKVMYCGQIQATVSWIKREKLPYHWAVPEIQDKTWKLSTIKKFCNYWDKMPNNCTINVKIWGLVELFGGVMEAFFSIYIQIGVEAGLCLPLALLSLRHRGYYCQWPEQCHRD